MAWLFILLSLLNITSGHGQSQNSPAYLPQQTFTTREGLAQNQVRPMIEDSYGRVWIGTQNGLSVFDGVSVRSVGADRGMIKGSIRFLGIERHGFLWGATSTAIFLYTGVSTHTWPLLKEFNESVFYLDPGGDPAFWHPDGDYVLGDSGFLPFQEANLWTRTQTPVNLVRNPGDPRVMILPVDGDTLWIYPATRLHRIGLPLSQGDTLFSPVWNNHYGRDIETLFQCRENPGIFYRVSASGRSFEAMDNPVIKTLVDIRFQTQSRPIDEDVFTRPVSPTWYGIPACLTAIRKDGLTDIYVRQDSFFRLVPLLKPPLLRSVLLDRSGQRLFIGSDEGFTLVHLTGWQIQPVPTCDNPWSVLPIPGTDHLLLACHNTGFQEMDPDGRIVRTSLLPQDELYGYLNQLFPGHTQVSYSSLACGGYRGAYFWNRSGVSHWECDESIEALSLHPVTRNVIAAGTRVYDLGKSPPWHSMSEVTVPKELCRNVSCSDIQYTPMGDTLWACGQGGVGRYNPSSKTWTLYRQENQSLPFEGAFTLELDPQGRLWCGGASGLAFYDPILDQFQPVLPDILTDQVSQILSPAADTLLVIEAKAFTVLHLDGEKIQLLRRFNHTSGFDLVEPNENGSWLDPKGQLWIPSISGLQRFDYPSLTRHPELPHFLLIERINGQYRSFDRQQSLDDTLRSGTLDLQVWIIGPKSAQAVLEFQLDNGKWTRSAESNRILLQDLPHGDHHLGVRVRLPDLLPASWPHLTGSIRVRLPFFQRRSTQYILISLAFLFAVFAMTTILRSWLDRRQLHRAQQQLQETRLRTIQAQLNPHFLFNAMTSLQNTIQNRSADEASEQLVRLSRLIRQVLELSVQQVGDRTQLPLVNLGEELELLQDYIHLEQEQRQPSFLFTLEVDPEVLEEDPLVPPLMIQPFVENAIQHGLGPLQREGNLWVRVSGTNGRLVYEIEDDGVGRTASIQARQDTAFHHNSHGVALLRERIQLLNELGYPASLNVEDRPKGGTLVIIHLTLPE